MCAKDRSQIAVLVKRNPFILLARCLIFILSFFIRDTQGELIHLALLLTKFS
jgi:hypothetical protein